MGNRKQDFTGQRFGYLTALGPTHRQLSSGRLMPAWRMRCDCGSEIVVMTTNLMKGNSRSCGCMKAKLSYEARGCIGVKDYPEYPVYRQMKERCRLKTARNYRWYGGRGIRVCQRWLEGEEGKTGFQCFIEDMGRRPKNGTIDRIDPNGNYEPSNCRWASWEEQGNNTRANRNITVNGKTRTVSQWAKKAGITPGSLIERLDRGWPVEAAVTTPALKHWDRRKGALNPYQRGV